MTNRLLAGIDVFQSASSKAPPIAIKAIEFAGQLARLMGASVYVDEKYPQGSAFLSRGKIRMHRKTPGQGNGPVIELTTGPFSEESKQDQASVVLNVDPFETEVSVFAASGLSHLLGDPEREPLVPRGDFGAGTIGYGMFAALCAVAAKMRRFGARETAFVDGRGVLSWVNWKAAIASEEGGGLRREGKGSEWPVMSCLDGYFALIYTERDWKPLVEMVGDERLRDQKFQSLAGRREHRDSYLAIIQEWAGGLSKRELVERFTAYQIPSAPVMSVADLLNDPLLVSRAAFTEAIDDRARVCLSPVLPHRVEAVSPRSTARGPNEDGNELPLAGLRVLDLGIITAGAGVAALLADMGAEVLKIESATHPDPFRAWAGDEVSPYFKGNNRNKLGIGLNLKVEGDRQEFERLVKSADVVLENFRRGVLDRLGYTYEALRALNPDLLLASVSGSGLKGPGSESSSYGSTLEASSGFASSIYYDSDQRPYITGRNVNYPDQTVVLYAAAAITAALTSTHPGMHLDISQRDVAVFISGAAIENASCGDVGIDQVNARTFRALDGRWIAMATESLALVDATNVMKITETHAAEDAIAELADLGVRAVEVLTGLEVLKTNLQKANDVFLRSPDGALVKGVPFQLQGSPMEIYLNAPQVGEHTQQFTGSHNDMPRSG